MRGRIGSQSGAYNVIAGKNWPMPPRTMNTPIARLTMRLSLLSVFVAVGRQVEAFGGQISELTRCLRSPSLLKGLEMAEVVYATVQEVV